jgi:hypothetical protein
MYIYIYIYIYIYVYINCADVSGNDGVALSFIYERQKGQRVRA